MRKNTVTALVIVLICGIAIFVLTGHKRSICSASEPTWQSSESAEIQLGVRDKYAELGSYTADFIVTDAKHKQYKVRKNVNSDDWAFVYFPEDFSTWGEPGSYTWKCMVRGKPVIGGKFRITRNGLVMSSQTR